MFTTLSDARKIQERIYSAATCCEGMRNVSPDFVLKYSQNMWGNHEQPDGREAHGLCAELDVVFRLLQSFEKSAVYWNIFMNSKQGYSVAEFDFFIIVPEGVLLLEVKNYSQNAEWRAGRQPDTWEKVVNGKVVDTLSAPFRQATHEAVVDYEKNAPLYQAQFMKALAAVNEQVFTPSKVFSRHWLRGEQAR